MDNHLKRVLNLVRRTGDTMIVVDKDGRESFVVMDLDQYETLLDAQFLGEDWEGEMMEQKVQSQAKSSGPGIWDVMQEAGEEGETWDVDQLNEEEFSDLEKQYEAFASKNEKDVLVEDKPNPAFHEKSKNLKKEQDDEYGEEQFYLEPIE